MRRRALLVTAELVEDVLRPPPAKTMFVLRGEPVEVVNPPFQATRCVRGLPDGARLVGADVNHQRELVLVFEHESFEDISEPPLIPGSEMVFERQAPNRCSFGHECAACRT